MKVIHIELGRHLYGGARQVAYLMNGLHAHPGEHLLVTCEDAALLDAVSNPAIRLQPLAFSGDLDFGCIQRLRHLIRKERPDVLHIHSRRGDWLSALAGRLENIPMVYSRRVDNPPNWLERYGKFPLFQTIITISEGIRDVLIRSGVESGRITCIHSAVDTDRYTPTGDRQWFLDEFKLPAETVTLGMIAQFIPRKGHAVLFDALPEVLTRHPEVRVLLFGKGPLRDELAAEIRRRNWDEKVYLAGFRNDMERITPCLDLLIHPARMEGLGVSLLEASAAGVPIIATRAGGIPEVVKPGVNGELIDIDDSETLTRHLLHLLAHPELRRHYGKAGRQWILDTFAIPRMVRDNHRIYETLLPD